MMLLEKKSLIIKLSLNICYWIFGRIMNVRELLYKVGKKIIRVL